MNAQRLLLDSHTLFWALRDGPELSGGAREMILDDATDVFVSSVSFYELMFKARRRRLDTAMLRVDEATKAAGFAIRSPREHDWRAAARYDWSHGDPFDRLLLAQAEGENMALVSKDVVFDEVTDIRLW